MKKHKKSFIIILVCASIIFIFIVGFIIYMLKYFSPSEYFIFQNINECERLIPTEQSDLTIERYTSPDKDKYLKDLSYKDFWGMKLLSNELEFEIFAYEFVDSDSALKYYINVTRQNSYKKELPLSTDNDNKRLSSSKGMFVYRLVVVYQNKAYLVVAPSQYDDAINKLLSDTMTYKLF
ncbi:MAG: hypothetical protein IJ292_01285 [Clostridia bacterium]|nr:hypothetical protein [Clostridia bacterium]